jgi:hypothetical protein
MRNAETVLGVLRERGRRRWPLERIYRLLFNPELYLLAYGRIYSNKGAMTPGVTWGSPGKPLTACRWKR